MQCHFESKRNGDCGRCNYRGGAAECYNGRSCFTACPAYFPQANGDNHALLEQHSLGQAYFQGITPKCQQPRIFQFASGLSYDLTSVSQAKYVEATKEFLKSDQVKFHERYKQHYEGIVDMSLPALMGNTKTHAANSKDNEAGDSALQTSRGD